ncbi:MAG: hypothetical protein RBJ76_18690 [Stenomitos frigidus ULC029]
MHTFILQIARIPEKYLSDRTTRTHQGVAEKQFKAEGQSAIAWSSATKSGHPQ